MALLTRILWIVGNTDCKKRSLREILRISAAQNDRDDPRTASICGGDILCQGFFSCVLHYPVAHNTN